MYIVLLGPPGSGKGTQAKLLAQRLNLCAIAPGDLFRRHQERATPLGLRARKYVERGELVPDDLTTAMVEEEFASLDQGKGCLFDGYPRNLVQGQALDQVLACRDRRVDRVLSLSIPYEELVRRLSGRLVCRGCQASYHLDFSPSRVLGRCDRCGGELYQRQDDSPDVVRQRIRVYIEQTEPVLQHYREKESVVDVDGTGEVEEVNRRLLEAVRGGDDLPKS